MASCTNVVYVTVKHVPLLQKINQNSNSSLHFQLRSVFLSTLTIAAIKTLKPKASEMSTKSPFDCVQAAQEKKLRMKMPMNSANMDRHKLFDLVSLTPNVYLKAIVGAGMQ